MKKLLLALFLGTFVNVSLDAQCVPDTTISGVVAAPAGTKLDTINKGAPNEEAIAILPYATVGMPYSEVIYFRVPKDTVYFNTTVPINYVKLNGVTGLPAGFQVDCSISTCKFPGGTFGCARLSGTPTTSDSIRLGVAIEFEITYGGLTAPIKDTLRNFIYVAKGQSIGLEENKVLRTTARVFPNPAKDKIILNFDAKGGRSATLQISSIIGTLVYNRTFTAAAGDNNVEVNTSDFKPGIYMYSLKVDNKNISGRFTISR